jgi:hypothetical protein
MNETPWIIEPLSMFNAIVHPSFTDLLPPGDGAYDGVMQDFMVMDNVPYKRPIVDIRKMYNVLAPRDKSCEVIYKKIGSTGLRDIETLELIAATKNCKHEFYQGALRDWASKDMETFGSKIVPFFLGATRLDIASNAWFGDITRAATSSFNTNSYNGIVSWIKAYIADGTIAAAQTYVPTAVDYRLPANYAAAYAAIDNAYVKQTELMHNLSGLDKVIYCDEATLAGYNGYLRTLGTTSEVIDVMFGGSIRRVNSYNGIPIIVVPVFGPILNDILGAGYHHMVILTIRRNFIFATDKNYGEGPNFDQALVIWYRQYDLSWYYQQFLKAGTQIALPEFIVFGISA